MEGAREIGERASASRSTGWTRLREPFSAPSSAAYRLRCRGARCGSTTPRPSAKPRSAPEVFLLATDAKPVTDGLEIEGARHLWIDTGEVRLHAVEAGSGPLVVLLHGFPEFWWSWRHQIPALAAAGFHVVAPDLRGYNLSDRPKRVRDYAVPHLTSDVAAVIRAMGEQKAHIVGHDWGGGVAYSFAMRYPEM